MCLRSTVIGHSLCTCVEREREREREYIYIETYVCVHVFVYVCVHEVCELVNKIHTNRDINLQIPP